MLHSSNSSRFDHPNTIDREYRSLSSSLCSFLHSPVTSSPLGPNILLSTLFSNTLTLRSSLNVSDQVLHPFKTTGNIIVLYILNCRYGHVSSKKPSFCPFSRIKSLHYSNAISEFFCVGGNIFIYVSDYSKTLKASGG